MLENIEESVENDESTTVQSSSSSSSSEESKKTKTSIDEKRDHCLKGAGRQEACLNPFHLRWAFGKALKVRMVNLTNKDQTKVFYAATHAAIIYDYKSYGMKLLQGHKNLINSISTDDIGKFVVTADIGDDSSIIVWDSSEGIPVHTMFNPHSTFGVAVVKISESAKYIVSVGCEFQPIIKFWLWTYGKEEPDDSCGAKYFYGAAVRVRYNPNVEEHIMIAFEKMVAFYLWDGNAGKLIDYPTTPIKNKRGIITDCVYVDKCHECFACTTSGCILVYGSTSYTLDPEEAELQNNKVFVKLVKISSARINCMQSVDGIIATGDTRGEIKFYDKRLRILYWCQNFSLPSITSITFGLDPRRYKIEDPFEFDDDDNLFPLNGDFEDKSEEYEHLYAQLIPSDATLQRLPFIVRDFIIATCDGRIAAIDYMNNKCDFLNQKAEYPIGAIETHDEMNYLCIGYADGYICLYDYMSRELIVAQDLPDENQFAWTTEDSHEVTALKYSPESLHLACGRANGSIWFLDPIHLTPKHPTPYRPAKGSIIKMDFSLDSLYFACYDNHSTVCLMWYDTQNTEWVLLGKLKSHYKPITDILFTPFLPTRFFSIGQDRQLVEYDLQASCDGEMELISSERIEQVAIPISFTYCPEKEGISDRYFFITDDQYKYKTVHDITFMCRSVLLGPAYGCYDGSPVKKARFLPQHTDKYLIYSNDKHFGIQLLPIDGNPYKYVGTVGHPKRLIDFKSCREGKFVFTFGENDNCVLMWQVNFVAPHVMAKLGGPRLEPFYCLIEGGIFGWLFKEMEDLFYYMQILHEGENTVLPRIVTDKIPAAELPDLMRACGYYPTEFEIENMITDVKYRNFDETKTVITDVSFLDFIKLYVNYKPVYGITIQKLEEGFEVLCQAAGGSNSLSAESFVTTVCEKGEVFSASNVHTCLTTLMHETAKPTGDSYDFSFLPDEIDFDTFLEDMLGMDLDRQNLDDPDRESNHEEYEPPC